nr:MAG TPA: Copper binding octapeptide repeat protein [Caudoviricetes sp.]
MSAFSAFSFVTILFLIFYDWIFIVCRVCFYLSFIRYYTHRLCHGGGFLQGVS